MNHVAQSVNEVINTARYTSRKAIKTKSALFNTLNLRRNRERSILAKQRLEMRRRLNEMLLQLQHHLLRPKQHRPSLPSYQSLTTSFSNHSPSQSSNHSHLRRTS